MENASRCLIQFGNLNENTKIDIEVIKNKKTDDTREESKCSNLVES